MTTTADPALPTAADFIANHGPLEGEAPEGYGEALAVAERILAPNLDAGRSVMSSDEFLEAGGPTLHLNGDIADALLLARGWTIEQQPRGGWKFITPDGEDFMWHRDEALTLALTAEGLAAQGL